MNKIEKSNLIRKARLAAKSARPKLSGFHVGAAILAEGGAVYLGANIEFDNYSNTIHAEESAVSAFVMAGEKKMLVIAVYTNGSQLWWPCGMCRQSLYELSGGKLEIIACNDNESRATTIEEILPGGFLVRNWDT